MQKEISVNTTKKKEILDITERIQKVINGAAEGICLVFALHTTAGLMLGEYEGGLDADFINMFGQLSPKGPFLHAHNPNHAPSHLFSSLVGEQIVVPVSGGNLVLGTWQRIMLVEFDGPRDRRIIVQTIKNGV